MDYNKTVNFISAKEGYPSNILIQVKNFRKEDDYTLFIKHTINVCTQALLSSQNVGLNNFNVYCLFDNEVDKKNLDYKLLVHIAKTLIDLFPQKLHLFYIYNPPNTFKIMYGLLKKMLDKECRQKIIIVDNDNQKSIDEYEKEI